MKLLPGPGSVVSLPPSRVMDTRTNLGATGPVAALGAISLQITGQGGVPATGVSAVIVYVTAVDPTSGGYLTVWPSGATRTTTRTGTSRPEHPQPGLRTGRRLRKDSTLNGSPGPVNLLADITGYLIAD